MKWSYLFSLTLLMVIGVLCFVAETEGGTCQYKNSCSRKERYTVKCGIFNLFRCTKYRTTYYDCYKQISCTYSSWSCGSCSTTCGTGTQTCTRTCSSSSPSCSRTERRTQTCRIARNGGWSAWSGATCGSCSKECCQGRRTCVRSRKCNNPIPANGGSFCAGSNVLTFQENCHNPSCNVSGGWSEWTGETCDTCSGDCCFKKTQCQQRRTCTSPSPQCGGAQCAGSDVRSYSRECPNTSCRSNGGWSEWGEENCVSCGNCCQRNRQCQQRRTCTNPSPKCGGAQCTGSDVKTYTGQCPNISCSVTCNSTGEFHAHPCTACSNTFFRCTGPSTAVEQTCAKGTFFNPNISVCDWPSNIKACTDQDQTLDLGISELNITTEIEEETFDKE